MEGGRYLAAASDDAQLLPGGRSFPGSRAAGRRERAPTSTWSIRAPEPARALAGERRRASTPPSATRTAFGRTPSCWPTRRRPSSGRSRSPGTRWSRSSSPPAPRTARSSSTSKTSPRPAASPTSPRGSCAPSTAGSSDAPPPYRQVVPYRTFKRSDAQPLVPGEIAELVFDLLPMSYLFQPGHRIRLAIAGADASHFAILPGGPPALHVHRSRLHASRIDLPVVG